jgi:catalase
MAKKPLTTGHVVAVADNHNPLTAGQRDPALLQDGRLIEKQEITL